MPFVLLFVTVVFLLSTAVVVAVVAVASFLSSTAFTNTCELMAIRTIIVQNDFIIFGGNRFVGSFIVGVVVIALR